MPQTQDSNATTRIQGGRLPDLERDAILSLTGAVEALGRVAGPATVARVLRSLADTAGAKQ